MNAPRQQLIILALSVLVLTVCAFPSRIRLKRALELENLKDDSLVKRVQEMLPRSSLIAELKNDLAQLSARSSNSEISQNGYKRFARRCAAGQIYNCFTNKSGRRRNVIPY
ncbi:uncharacterized protein LOC144629238 [Oculina patagonica]